MTTTLGPDRTMGELDAATTSCLPEMRTRRGAGVAVALQKATINRPRNSIYFCLFFLGRPTGEREEEEKEERRRERGGRERDAVVSPRGFIFGSCKTSGFFCWAGGRTNTLAYLLPVEANTPLIT